MRELLSRFKNKKAFTLAELCVVLALVAIVSTTIITMSTLIQRRVTRSVNNDRVVADLTSIELSTKNWINRFDNADYNIVIAEDGTSLTAKNAKTGAMVSTLTFDQTTRNYESSLSTIRMSAAIQSVEFTRYPTSGKSTSGKTMIKCFVTYILPENNEAKGAPLMFTLRSGAILNR